MSAEYLQGVVSQAATLRRPVAGKVALGNVLALGSVSMLTDVSSEMVTAVLPAYLVLGLHLSYVQYGLIDGIYTGATIATRLIGGYAADRWRCRKLLAGVGYGVSAAAKVGLLIASGAVSIAAVVGLDRLGKGLRTAPRDAMIAGSVPPTMLGRAFGVHRAMDAAGAFAGPLVAFLVLAMVTENDEYQAVFLFSFVLALLGVLVMVLFVRDQSAKSSTRVRPERAQLRPLWHLRPFRRLCIAAGLLGLATVGDGFIYLVLQRRADLPTIAFPLLAAGTSLVLVVLAVPLGRLADRVGRWPVVAGGYGCLLAVYLLLGAGGPVLLVLGLYGAFYAATDGVLSALAASWLPENLRATGLSVLQSLQAGRLPGLLGRLRSAVAVRRS